MIFKSRVTILVKAYPQPSRKHQETVCCAGLDEYGKWKRLYPIRFRQLKDEQIFRRWNTVSFTYSLPKSDTRKESCRVHEESIVVTGNLSKKTPRKDLVDRAIVPSEKAAAAEGHSLALIRPENVSFSWEHRTVQDMEEARAAFEAQARQASMFDKELDILEPCQFKFKMHYDDADGHHTKTCGDWETSAAFFKLSQKYGSDKALEHLLTCSPEKSSF